MWFLTQRDGKLKYLLLFVGLFGVFTYFSRIFCELILKMVRILLFEKEKYCMCRYHTCVAYYFAFDCLALRSLLNSCYVEV